jgi:hypothetical protein
MAVLNRCQAALRIFGGELVPEELSRLFDHAYTKGWVKGYKYSTASGRVVVKNSGAWILDAEQTESGDFDGQISQLLAHTNVSLGDWHSLSKRFELDIFCGWFMQNSNEGIEISPQTLLMLGERNIALSIDIYGPCDDKS